MQKENLKNINNKFGFDIYTCISLDNGDFEPDDCIEDSFFNDSVLYDTEDEAYDEGIKSLQKYKDGDYLMEVYKIVDWGVDFTVCPNVYNHNGEIRES